MEFTSDTTTYSSSVNGGHSVFATLSLHLVNSPTDKSSDSASESKEKSETPPPILDCYPSTETIDGRMIIEEYMRANCNDDDSIVLANEAGLTEHNCLLGSFPIDSTEPSTSNGFRKPPILQNEKKAAMFSENTQVRRSARQIKRKWKTSDSPEGRLSKSGKTRSPQKCSSTKAQIYETGPIKGVIRVGEDYQCSVPEWESNCEIVMLSEDELERETCLWSFDGTIDADQLEEFYQVVRRQFGIDPSKVLDALQQNNFELLSAMEHIEEFVPASKKPFTVEEQRLFFKGLATYGKDFRLIRSEFLTSRSVRELVEFYYNVKNTKCFGSLKKCCPKLLRLDAVEEAVVSRLQCDNCTGNTKKGVKIEEFRFCAICDLYYRKTGRLRPFSVQLDEIMEKKDPNIVELSEVCFSSNGLANHNLSCSYTAPRLKRLQEETRWTPFETETAVQAFFLFGKDFQAVSTAIGSKSAAAVKRFYVEKQSLYRLDFLINRPLKLEEKYMNPISKGFMVTIGGFGKETRALGRK